MYKNKSKEYLADILLVVVAIVWGSTFLLVQNAVKDTPVFTFLFYRFALACVVMGIFSFKEFKKLEFKTIKNGILLGIFLFLGFAFQTFALQYSISSSVAFITGLNVVIVPIIVFLFFKSEFSMYSFFGAIIAAIGLYFISFNGKFEFNLGEFLAFICAICFALQIALTSFYVKNSNTYLLVFFQLLCVSVLSFICACVFENGVFDVKFSTTFVNAILITALFATVFAFFVQTAVQKFTTPSKTAIIFTLEPVSAGFVGYFYAHEMLSFLQLFGAFCILFGILFAELNSHKKPYM